MSWAYWAPKSTTRTRSWSASPVARDMSAAYRRAPAAPAPDAPQGPADQGARPGPGSGLPEQRRGWATPREGVRRRDPLPSTTSGATGYGAGWGLSETLRRDLLDDGHEGVPGRVPLAAEPGQRTGRVGQV